MKLAPSLALNRPFATFCVIAFASVWLSAQDQAPSRTLPGRDVDAWIELMREVYEKAWDSSGKLTHEVKNWLREDLKKIGTWDYKIVDVPAEDASSMESRMNELGKERWECFQAVPMGESIRLFFKKPALSYIQAVPSENLLKLLPKGE